MHNGVMEGARLGGPVTAAPEHFESKSRVRNPRGLVELLPDIEIPADVSSRDRAEMARLRRALRILIAARRRDDGGFSDPDQ